MNGNLLLNEQPIIILPTLAKVLEGQTEAAVIQQIHYWISHNKEKNKHLYDGCYWMYYSIKEWQESEFSYLSPDTLRRAISNLEKKGVVKSRKYLKGQMSQTKWYTIDYERLYKELEKHNLADRINPFVQNAIMGIKEANIPLPEATPTDGQPLDMDYCKLPKCIYAESHNAFAQNANMHLCKMPKSKYATCVNRFRQNAEMIYRDKPDKTTDIEPPISPTGDEGVTETQPQSEPIEPPAENGESLSSEKATEQLNGEAIPPTQAPSTTRRSRRKTELAAEQMKTFEQFWAVWPNKVSRGQAEITWGKLNPDADLLAAILDGVERNKKYDKRFRPGSTYMPYPSTWLNAKGWLDELEINPVSVQQNAQPANRFVNFEQRDMDFKELERQEQEYMKRELENKGKPKYN